MKKLFLLFILSMVSMLAFAQSDSSAPPPDNVTLSPSPYDFDTVAVQYPYYEVFTVNNNRETPLEITSITVTTTPPFHIVSALTTCPIYPPFKLPANSSCQITVEELALSPGDKSGTLTVGCDAGACPLTSALSAHAVHDVTLNPTSCSFASYVGEPSSTCTVVLTNNLPTTLTTSIEAVPDPPFMETNNCGRVPALGTCNINVWCTPDELGTVTGNLNVSDNAPDGTPPSDGLSCTGVPMIHCTPLGCQP